MPFRASHDRAHQRRAGYWAQHLPAVAQGTAIPKTLHHIFLSGALPAVVARDLAAVATQNPGWTITVHDNDAAERFIAETYGAAVLALYRRIDPRYGAARADLFRYLLLYRTGGVYLDIKSRFLRPIDEVIAGDEGYVLSQWRNGAGERFGGFGLHPDLAHVPGGEFQIFHIIAAAGHPFLRAVIAAVLANIELYSPWRTSVGRIGVLRLTGPIAMTRAIWPIVDRHLYRRLSDHSEIALESSVYEREVLFRTPHYSALDMPIVTPGPLGRVSGRLFAMARAMKERLRR